MCVFEHQIIDCLANNHDALLIFQPLAQHCLRTLADKRCCDDHLRALSVIRNPLLRYTYDLAHVDSKLEGGPFSNVSGIARRPIRISTAFSVR